MNARRLKILLVPLIILLMMFSSFAFMLYFGFKSFDELVQFISFSKIITISIKSMIEVTVYYFVVRWLNKVLPWNKTWIFRFAFDMSTVLLMAFLGISLLFYFEKKGILPMGAPHGKMELIYIIPLIMNSLYLVFIEMILAIEDKNKLIIKLAQLEKQQIHTKYQALKSQLDHHFLFNNLSVLSSIIYEDVEKSDIFIQKLSKVYRYVLSINKRDLISVQEEIEFITSYLDLYKYRFEDGFCYKINIEPRHLSCLIPPLTLQVLVENTIKHNVVSRNQPLKVNIFDKNETLVVQNNIQLRETLVDSTQTGLNNLKEKYELLGANIPAIVQEDGYYKVQISLIPNKNG